MAVVRERRRRLRARPLIHLVPNMFTVISLCFGLTSIRYALEGRFELAVVLIVVAGVFDALDGRSARLLKTTSKLGAQLDSLSDFLSFGVAPALLIYLWSLNQVRGFGWVLCLLFATCCALRLARFNTELEDPDKPAWMSRFFVGMPAPAAAGCAMIPMVMSLALRDPWPRSWTLNAVVIVFVAMMMVSRVPTFSFKMVMLRVRPEWVLPTLIFVGLFVASLLHVPWLTLLALGAAYVASLPVSVLVARRLRHRHEEERAAAAAAEPSRDAEERRPERVINLGLAHGSGDPPEARRR